MGTGTSGDPEAAAKLATAMADIEANQKKMDELNKTWEQKLKEAEEAEAKEDAEEAAELAARNSGGPQLLNLNDDMMLDRKNFVDLQVKNPAIVGKANLADQSKNPTVVLGGTGI
jgi:hypothetical protein